MRTIIAHDLGYTELLKAERDFVNDDITAILVDVAHVPNPATETEFSDVSGDECVDTGYAEVQLSSKTILFNDEKVKFNHAKINFTATAPGGRASINGKYIYLIFGTAGSLNPTDRILGHIDLTTTGNASTVNGEFSFTPHADGLMYFLKPEPVA